MASHGERVRGKMGNRPWGPGTVTEVPGLRRTKQRWFGQPCGRGHGSAEADRKPLATSMCSRRKRHARRLRLPWTAARPFRRVAPQCMGLSASHLVAISLAKVSGKPGRETIRAADLTAFVRALKS